MKTEPGEVRAEARLRTGDAEIRHHREPEPAADRRTMNRADDRLLGAEQPHRLDVEMADPALRQLFVGPAAIRREAAAVAEIGAGAERLALRCQHHRAA